MKRAFVGLFAVLLLAGACVDQTEVGTSQNGLVDGVPESVGLLAFLNAPSTTFAVLDDEVPLDRRAATNLMAARPFTSVAQVDAVKYVGEKSLAKLVEFATAQGFVPSGSDVLGSYDGVEFTVDQAEAALRIVNEESDGVLSGEVKLDSRAINSILAARPVVSMDHLAGLYWVGTKGLERLRDYVTNFIPEPDVRADCRHHGECAADERCRGITEIGRSVEYGKCAPLGSLPGYWDDCSDSNPCQDNLFCSGQTWGGGGWCSPMWMQDTFYNETQRFIPQDGSIVATGVYVYGQASVPMDIVLDIDLSHSNPHDLTITVYDPQGTDAVVWDGPNMTGQPFPSTFVAMGNISRDDMVNGRWLLRVVNVGGGGTGNLHKWNMWISSRWD